MCAAQKQLWQHSEKFGVFCLVKTVFFPELSHFKLLVLMSARRKANWVCTLAEVILGYQSKIPSKHCPKFYSSLWQLWLWLPCSQPTVSVAPSLSAASFCLPLSFAVTFSFAFSSSLTHSFWVPNWPVSPPPPLVCIPHMSLSDCTLCSYLEKRLLCCDCRDFQVFGFNEVSY